MECNRLVFGKPHAVHNKCFFIFRCCIFDLGFVGQKQQFAKIFCSLFALSPSVLVQPKYGLDQAYGVAYQECWWSGIFDNERGINCHSVEWKSVRSVSGSQQLKMKRVYNSRNSEKDLLWLDHARIHVTTDKGTLTSQQPRTTASTRGHQGDLANALQGQNALNFICNDICLVWKKYCLKKNVKMNI